MSTFERPSAYDGCTSKPVGGDFWPIVCLEVADSSHYTEKYWPRTGASVCARSSHKCAATLVIAGGIVAGMCELERKYRSLAERISGYPMGEAARARVLAEIEGIYRRERAAEPLNTPPGDLGETRH